MERNGKRGEGRGKAMEKRGKRGKDIEKYGKSGEVAWERTSKW